MRRAVSIGLCLVAGCFTDSQAETGSGEGTTGSSPTSTPATLGGTSTEATTTTGATSEEDDTGSSSSGIPNTTGRETSTTGTPTDCADRITLLFDELATDAGLEDLTFPLKLDASHVDYAIYDAVNVSVRDANDQPIPYRLDIWREGGDSVFWVRAPIIDAEHDRIFVCFGPKADPLGGVWLPEVLAVWNFRDPEKSGGVRDASTHGNVGSVGTTQAPNPGVVASPLGEALVFHHQGNFVEVPDSPSLNPTESLTIEAVVRRTTDNPQWQTIAHKPTAYNLRVVDGTNEAGAEVFFSTQSSIAERVPELPVNEYVYIAAVFDRMAGTLRVCTNGVTCESTQTPTDPLGGSNTPLDLGRGDIEIDHLRLTEVARSPAWIAAAGRGFAGGLLVELD